MSITKWRWQPAWGLKSNFDFSAFRGKQNAPAHVIGKWIYVGQLAEAGSEQSGRASLLCI